MAEPDYLLVLTRDPRTHPSARYTLRGALARCRRGCEVTVYLTDDAVDSCVGDSPLLARLIAAGMRVLVDVEACRVYGLAILDIIGKPATDEDLTTLLLTPGINAEWC